MKIAVFDVDDTLIKHAINSESYYTGTVRSNFKDLLSSKNYEKVYLYTNGTYEHGKSVAQHLGIIEDISYIYARDNLKTELKNNHMKPSLKSFNFVNKSIEIDSGSIQNDIYFFDDLKQNLRVAKDIGWNTVLIKPNGMTEEYIDYVYPNIYSALISMI